MRKLRIMNYTIKQKFREKLSECRRFIDFVIYHFIEDDCTYRASALAFTTLLAIVPLMSVGFAVLSSFPVFHNLAAPIQNFIFDNFVPSTGKAVQNYLLMFATQVSRLSIVGIIFLFVTALLVMYTIERSMNKIWRVSSPRKGVSAFLLYWAILSLAPFLLGLSLAASSYFVSMPFIKGHAAPALLVSTVPFFLSLVGFTFLYVVVPNCPVRLIHGLYGALVSAVLFEAAKQAFAYYLSRYDTYQLLYGAFAMVPIFFIWIYWVWLITLLGAEISYALSVHYQRRQGIRIDGFSHALLWLNKLWKAQALGKEISLEELIDVSQQPFSVDIGDMLNQLIDLKLIQTTANGKYLLSRDLSHLSIYELSQLLPYRLPNSLELMEIESPIVGRWKEQINAADNASMQILQMSLDEFFRQDSGQR
jgi:membrane protein